MKRRDVRRPGPGPYLLGLERDPDVPWGDEFPYDVPAVAAVEAMRLDAPVTLLAGDNGTGKSTLIGAFAEAFGFAPQGGELERAGELPPVPRPVLGGALRPELDETGFNECDYDALDVVRLTRGFLDDPERYLRAALGDD